jgi:hypothetical protein
MSGEQYSVLNYKRKKILKSHLLYYEKQKHHNLEGFFFCLLLEISFINNRNR